MLTIKHSYGADLDWIESFAASFGGKIEGNFIKVPEEINTGFRYFIDCGDDFVIYYIDVVYKTEIHFIQSHTKSDFICLYYNLTEGKAVKAFNDFSFNMGRFGYDLALIDSTLETDFYVAPDARSFGICIFVKKSKLNTFAQNNVLFAQNVEKVMNPEKNTFIKFDRMSPESFHLLSDLRKLEVGSAVFNLNLVAAAYSLGANYMNQVFNNTITTEKVNKDDLSSIIAVQAYLHENVDGFFPSIKTMADKAFMSESKFKALFKKITGTTPHSYFMDSKLRKAKELLEEKKYTISETCDELKFTNYSYFIFKFRKHFGISPNTFIKKL
ncbi:AraC-type DNA-binding protein [Flavobacterium resistens]|uniref:AraC-type DNA-binding protein n=1 Tax=Flavobacterium resistens TaxID=443612 RepID=A0A521EZH7_9FLAO|nr:AraC family transcriptional regulator [Flavobacterium resistens]MRX69321.1 helix-turn-helix domain-containing protein [Flavobacterium resistens]SMO89226.1 AraC-type DNA-binding protein [Flavobacterium resistens]